MRKRLAMCILCIAVTLLVNTAALAALADDVETSRNESLLTESPCSLQGHVEVIIPAVPATCMSTGWSEEIYCSVCHLVLKEKQILPVDENAHDWDDPDYSNWSADLTKLTAYHICKYNEEHREEETADVVESVIAATCEADEIIIYTATFQNPFFEEQQIKMIGAAALGHANLLKTDAKEPTCVEAGNHSYWTCPVCHNVFADETGKTKTTTAAQMIPALGHRLIKTEDEPATCTGTGHKAYWTCSICGKVFADSAGEEETTAEAQNIAASGHAWKAVYIWSDDNLQVTAKVICANDESHEDSSAEETVETTCEVILKPTYDTPGKMRYTAVFVNTQFVTQTKEVEILKLESPQPPTDELPVSALPTAPFTDSVSNGIYKIGADGTAIFMKPAKSAASVSIPATITVNGQDVRVTAIADKAFQKDKKLTTVTIGKYIRTIGKNAFAYCVKLKTVKGGAAVVTIMDDAFDGCKILKSFPTLNKLQEIGVNAFKGVKALAKFTIAKTVKSIGRNAFGGCTGLKSISVKSEKLTTKNVGRGAFKGINKNATFKCPEKLLKDYEKLFRKKGAPKSCRFKR